MYSCPNKVRIVVLTRVTGTRTRKSCTHYSPYINSRVLKIGTFAMLETCENWLGLVNSCVYYTHQICEIYQVLPYSVDFKAPQQYSVNEVLFGIKGLQTPETTVQLKSILYVRPINISDTAIPTQMAGFMRPTGGPRVGPINLAIRVYMKHSIGACCGLSKTIVKLLKIISHPFD